MALVLAQSPDAALPPPTEVAPVSWSDRLLRNTAPVGLALNAELGFLGVLSNTIQFGHGGTRIDYLKDGGENTLFPFLRLSADITLFKRSTVILLYQPLDLSTSQLLLRDVTVDGEVFRQGTPVDFFYGFSFWRLSYLYNFLWAHPGQELAVGLSLQIRNADITFASRDGSQLRTNQDIGPVPILKVRGRYTFDNALWLGTEIDGFYAAIPGLNGGSSEVRGAIIDASIRAGVGRTPMIDGFLNLRVIGGGASGTSKNPRPPADGYVDNWLYTMSLSVGFTLKAPGRQ